VTSPVEANQRGDMADASEPVKPSDPGPWWMRPIQSLFTMTAEQQRGAVALILLGGAMWLIFSLVTDARRADNERAALLARVIESENQKNRDANEDNTKAVTAAFQAATVAQVKFEMRISDLNATNQKLEGTVQKLEQTVGRLEKQVGELSGSLNALNRKLPPMEVTAPMPRAKAVNAAG